MAAQAADERAVVDGLGLAIVGEASSEYSARYAMTRLANGWLIIVSHGEHLDFEKVAARAMPQGSVLAGSLSEVVMVSTLSGYRDGRRAWRVVHDPEVEHDGFQIDGAPPAEFSEIRRELEAAQAEETEEVDHVFDFAARLSRELCGFDPNTGSPTVWKLLGQRQAKGSGEGPFLGSMIAAELVPFLQSLGWAPKEGDTDVIHHRRVFDFIRRVDGCEQVIGFDFIDDGRPRLQVQFFVVDGKTPESRFLLGGAAGTPPAPPKPLLARLFGGKSKAEPERSREMIIAEARDDLAALHRFLSSGEASSRVQADDGLALETWPVIPPRPKA